MSTIPPSAGIYRIDGPNGGIYIGSTNNLQQRWRAHRSDLNHNRHGTRHLQNAWNKYGETRFTFTVLELIDNENHLLVIEQIWLDILFTSVERRKIYNSGRTAISSFKGKKHSEAARKRLSDATKAHWRTKTEDEKAQVRALLAESHREAIRRSVEVRRVRHPRKMHQQSFFNAQVGVRRSEKVLESQSRAHRKGKIYTMIAPDGTIYEDIPSLSGFAREHGMDIATVHNILHGKYKNRAGWHGYVTYAENDA